MLMKLLPFANALKIIFSTRTLYFISCLPEIFSRNSIKFLKTNQKRILLIHMHGIACIRVWVENVFAFFPNKKTTNVNIQMDAWQFHQRQQQPNQNRYLFHKFRD